VPKAAALITVKWIQFSERVRTTKDS